MSITKQCPGCGKVKDLLKDYHKNNKTKDGKQVYCKVCMNEKSKKFREKRPDYYWGNDGYFTERREETIQYVKDYQRADGSVKIYKLTLKDGSIYIGETKRRLSVRMNVHKNDFLKFRNGTQPYSPIVYQYMLGAGYSDEDIINVWKSVEIIEQFDGTKKEARAREKYWIQLLTKRGFTLRNYIGVPSKHRVPRRHYTKKNGRFNSQNQQTI